jgi:hypothetical protein
MIIRITMIHLGFDMGIRNLAYCLVEHKEDSWEIKAWDNIDLLEGGTSSQDAKKCVACTSPAKWMSADGKKWCQGCATGVRRKKTATEKPVFPTLSCSLSVKDLRELAFSSGLLSAKKAKKDELIAWVSSRYLMPWKPAKAMDSSLSVIRKEMDTWLNSVLPTFASASLIRLENQPVMKGPTMKSVQMILFTLLAHRLEREYGWTGSIVFVHAGTKTKDKGPVTASAATTASVTASAATTASVTASAATTAPVTASAATTVAEGTAAESAAYRARKKTAETEVVDVLSKAGKSAWLTFFNGRSKKSDLADAFLMALRK